MLSRLRGRIFVAIEPTDLRKSFDGLAALVAGRFGRDVFDGDLFVFANRRGTQLRILYWDRDGYVIWMKRLEAGTFRRPPSGTATSEPRHVIEIDNARLTLMLEGVDAKIITKRLRYSRDEMTMR